MKTNNEDIIKWFGPKCNYSKGRELADFYTQMNVECSNNHSRVIWEWLRNAPCLDEFHIDKFKMWKENGRVVSAVRLMSPWLGEAVIDNQCTDEETLHEIIKYTEENLAIRQDDKNYIFIALCEQQGSLNNLLQKEGFEKLSIPKGTLQYNLDEQISPVTLKEGFSIHRLSEVFDFDKLSKLLWLGFNYEGSVPKINDEVKPSIKHAWLNYNRDICSVVLDENGEFASFAGFWYDNVTQTAYLEPMVTLEKYRNMGLGKAAVYNSLKILKEHGCKKIFVDPDDDPYNYYLKIGFKHFEYAQYYQKTF